MTASLTKKLASPDVSHRPRRPAAGLLLARSGQSDVVAAAVVCLARDGDDILTSGPDDLRALAEAADLHVELIRV